MTLTRYALWLLNEAGRVDVWTDVESGSCCPQVILPSGMNATSLWTQLSR